MLNVMQIGYGYWGTNITRKLLASKMFCLKYLCEADESKREKAKMVIPKYTKLVSTYKEYLNDEIDAVVIVTQTEFSYQIALDAIHCGKHIFIEKPIASTVERTKALIEEAKKENVIIHCDHLMVYNPVIRYIKNMYDTGELGELMYIDISRINLGPIRKDVNAMLDLAVHDIAVIDFLSGGKEPYKLSAIGTSSYGKQETITYLTMKYPDFLVSINSSWVSPVKVRRSMIAGTKKMVIFDDVKTDKLTIYDSGIEIVQGLTYGSYEYKTRIGDIHIPHIEIEDSLQNSLEHFATCVAERKESLSGPEQCMRVMRILEWAQTELAKDR